MPPDPRNALIGASALRFRDGAVPARGRMTFRPSLGFVMFCALFACLWLAGGASRGDAIGQAVVRGVAWLVVIVAIVFEPASVWRRGGVIGLFLAAALVLILVQLIPLPPDLWQALPGRSTLMEAARVSGQDQPWRPIAIVPGAAINAAGSMIVPIAMLVALAGVADRESNHVPGLVLYLVLASALVGIMQFTGASLSAGRGGQVSGMFANRNHFALFTAIGCLVAPIWAYPDGLRSRWRRPVALAMILFFSLVILASGSRAGLLLGALAIGIGLTLVRNRIRAELPSRSRWALSGLMLGIVAVIAAVVLLSVVANRAVSIDRVLAIDSFQDIRSRALPTILAMVRDYFPFGSGAGGFKPVFQMHEPFALLKPTYLNQAHNDILGVALDMGLPGLLLLLCGLAWWGRATFRAWRGGGDPQCRLARLGSALLLLTMLASIFDYPARTPIIAAMIVLAAWWLDRGQAGAEAPTLPKSNQHL